MVIVPLVLGFSLVSLVFFLSFASQALNGAPISKIDEPAAAENMYATTSDRQRTTDPIHGLRHQLNCPRSLLSL